MASTRAMIAAGVGPGDRVAVWAPNGLGWIVAALGAQCAGAALVPINTRWKGGEAAHLLRASRAKVLCTSVGFLGTDTVAMLEAEPGGFPDLAHRAAGRLADRGDATAGGTGARLGVVRRCQGSR